MKLSSTTPKKKNKYFLLIVLFIIINKSFCFSQSWTATTTGTNCPCGRTDHAAVWAGDKMIIWGGFMGGNVNTGGIYDTLSKTWVATSTGANCPCPRRFHTGVSTGSKMIVWGGYTWGIGPGSYLNNGGVFDPATNIWTTTSITNAPSVRYAHTAIWTGSKMIIWGGLGFDTVGNSICLGDGGIYDLATDTWSPISLINAPSPRCYHAAVWTGSKMIVWSGSGSPSETNTGGIYDPATDTWTTTSTINAPSVRSRASVFWIGNKMLVWGGEAGGNPKNTGGIYDPTSDTWSATSTGLNCPNRWRYGRSYAWVNNRMIVWGGYYGGINYNEGSAYDPISETWVDIPITAETPPGRSYASAITAGNSMIIWGGYLGSFIYTNTGGIYGVSSVLPIELLSFNAKYTSKGIVVTWNSATEANNDFYTLEHSYDALNFSLTSYIKGAGNSNTIINYSYTDITPLKGTIYYRLKQTDYDANFKYLGLVSVKTQIFKKEDITIYPTITTSSITIENPSFSEGNSYIITIYNSESIMIRQQQMQKEKIIIDISNFMKGMYLVNVSNTTDFNTFKLFKETK